MVFRGLLRVLDVMSGEDKKYKLILSTAIVTVFTVSCGTMPVPSIRQTDAIAARSVEKSSATKEIDKGTTSVATAAAVDESAEISANRNKPAPDNNTTFADSADSKTVETPSTQSNPTTSNVTTTTTTTSTDSRLSSLDAETKTESEFKPESKPKPVEKDILQAPVISNANSSEAVLQAAVPITQSSTQKRSPSETQSTAMTTKSGNNSGSASAGEGQPMPSVTVSSKRRQDVPKFAVVTADDRVKNAIALLNSGEEQQAERELADALVIEPNNRSARKLMRQIHESPDSFFQQDEYFEYQLRSNENLVGVAEKFLDDPLEFYMLAKLNDIDHPDAIAPGKVLMIPGNKDLLEESQIEPEPVAPVEVQAKATKPSSSKPASSATPPASPPVKSEEDIKIERAQVYYAESRYREAINLLLPYAHKKPASEYAHVKELLAQCYLDLANDFAKKGDLLQAQTTLETSVDALPGYKPLNTQLAIVKNQREAERLYRLGLQESQSGKENQALITFAKALRLNPEHDKAKKQMIDLRLTVVEEYHKQAMVLYRKQELAKAIEIWKHVLSLDPDYDLAKRYLLRAQELQRKIEQL
jgi:tetratricopeptide (TPR) repeat protein